VLLVGATMVIWVQSTANSFERYAVDTNRQMRSADLIIDSIFDELPTASLQPRFSEEIIQEIAAVPGVAIVAADAETISQESGVGVMAVDSTRLQDSRLGPWQDLGSVESKALDAVAAGRGVLADSTFSRRTGLVVGDTLELITPTGSLSTTILGITPTAFISPEGDLVMSRSLYKLHWRDSTVNRVYVALDPRFEEESVRQALLRHVGATYGLRVRRVEEFSSWIANTVSEGFAFLRVIVVMTIIVVVVGTADALAANVVERTREIGTLRALGYSPTDIGKMVLAQAGAIGLAGSGLAVCLGLALSIAFVEGILEPTIGWNLFGSPSYPTAALVSVLGVGACILGGIPPAIRAARLLIVKALRYE